MKNTAPETAVKIKSVSYAKWGYIFIAPFFLIYAVFSLYPLLSTFYYSFFESYRIGLMEVGPNFVGIDNYIEIFANGDMPKYATNTLILWMMGFVPQIVIAMALANWFTSLRLRLHCTGFFKTVIYMPNLIMASAFSMLFYTIFSLGGPINDILIDLGIISEPFKFVSDVLASRSLIAMMNFLMWFGNTTILLMAAIMGIDNAMFEAAMLDGAKSFEIFRKITLPLIKPILVYVVITAMIGGIQMFDVPQVFTNGVGNPDRANMTLIMYLNKHLYSKNFGLGGAVSVILFVITAALSVGVYRALTADMREESRFKKMKAAKLKEEKKKALAAEASGKEGLR